MSDVMKPVDFSRLLNWILSEYELEKAVFGIPECKFFRKKPDSFVEISGEKCETPVGPAAGPHTQTAQSIISAYLTGGRYFELKTVQVLDSLEIQKPCIDARDEVYNIEWSTELTVQQAYGEYVKAWILSHVVDKIFGLSGNADPAFIFNMSVGYELKGIRSPKIDRFITELKDASDNSVFQNCMTQLKQTIAAGRIPGISDPGFADSISPDISRSVTLSTMHGCPPDDQEAICRYLLSEKRVHTFVKLNPTLLGYDFVRSTLGKLGFDDITLRRETFEHDMRYDDAVAMLRRLHKFAKEQNLAFGVKLSNTLAVENRGEMLDSDEMYMSGRSLFPLSIALAARLSEAFDGRLPISYSGGATFFNIKDIFETGIRPVTMASDLLKPGGYARMAQMAELLEEPMQNIPDMMIDTARLYELASSALADPKYRKDYRPDTVMKTELRLPLTDCFIAPCTLGCPVGQDIPEYIRLLGEKRYTEALEVILFRNPLPFITGFLCEQDCSLKCVRNDYDEPVMIRELKRMSAENGFENLLNSLKTPEISSDIRVAVIGAGPAGLASACFLARSGIDVTIFEKSSAPGGTVAHVIPSFRIPPWAIENDISLIRRMGVKFHLNSASAFDIEGLKSRGFKYVILAIGAGEPVQMRIEMDRNEITDAVEFLREFNRTPDVLALAGNVAVIGGGNSAMDAARAAIRVKNVTHVSIIYRRTAEQMPAKREELDLALEERVEFKELLTPVSFRNGILKCQVMSLGAKAPDGRRRPIPVKDVFAEFPFDTVLFAIGSAVDNKILEKNNIKMDDKQNIEVNQSGETGVENVFVAGDALRGPASIIKAVADGRTVASAILNKENIPLSDTVNYVSGFDAGDRMERIQTKKAVLCERKSREEEPVRCLECDLLCNKCVEVCPNRANIAIRTGSGIFKDINQIIHLDALCNECGNCTTFCPYEGSPHKDKLTLFQSHYDFRKSTNDGFFLNGITGTVIRFKGVIFRTGDIPMTEDESEYSRILELIRVLKGYRYLMGIQL